MVKKIFKIIKKICLIGLIIFFTGGLLILIFPIPDMCGLIIERVDDKALIAETTESAYYLTGLTYKYRGDTLKIHSYSKLVGITFLASRRTDRRGIRLKHPVKYISYRGKTYDFDCLGVYSDSLPQFDARKVLRETAN